MFRSEGELWTLTFADTTVRLRDSKGLRDIATLIARQGHELHVLDLLTTGGGATAPSPVAARVGAAGPVLDDRAREAYRSRIVELRDELAEAEGFGDTARAERVRTELDLLRDQLAAAFGLGGRPRPTADPVERARKAVSQRVRNVLRRIGTEHPRLARHLDNSLRLGTFCSYKPEHSTSWIV